MHARALVIPVGGAGVFGSDPSAEFTERKSRRSMARRHQRLWVPLAGLKFAHSLDIRQVCYQFGKVDSQFQTGKIADRKNCSRKERICWADDAASHSRPSFGAFYCPPPTLSRLPPPSSPVASASSKREKHARGRKEREDKSEQHLARLVLGRVWSVYARVCLVLWAAVVRRETIRQTIGRSRRSRRVRGGPWRALHILLCSRAARRRRSFGQPAAAKAPSRRERKGEGTDPPRDLHSSTAVGRRRRHQFRNPSDSCARRWHHHRQPIVNNYRRCWAFEIRQKVYCSRLQWLCTSEGD